MDLRTALWNLLGFGALPLWLAAGGADWLCHRRTRIEKTSGPAESRLHLLLHLEIAIPVLLALWFRITTLMLLLMALGVATHMFTSWWDTSVAQPRRFIAPIEQQVHSWLEMLPLFALVCVALLHLPELVSPRWTLEARAQPAPVGWRIAVVAGFSGGLLLIAEEWWRGVRAQRAPSAAPHW
jgi:hypothetical protein